MDVKDISVIAVDDDEAILRVLGRIFGESRSFASFSGSAEFLAGAKLQNCDIVFMDINIPGGQDGITLTRHIKRAAPLCDVVVMTGSATLNNALEAIKAGAYDFMQKPFSVDYVEAIVRRCAEKRALSTELKLLKAAQEELSAAYSQLKSSERIKEAFLSVIGHELRTPLAKIIGGTDLLRADASGQQQEILNAVSAGASELQAAIESIILYADLRKESAPGTWAPVDLNGTAGAVLRELSGRAAGAGVSLQLHSAPEEAVVYGDPELLRNALKRLVLNAITFNQKGGTAEISVTDGPASAGVTVSDTGIGIPEELISGLGTPFYQIADYMTRKTGGLGLGLAIVKQVVEAHDGRMSVKKREGGGTAFTLTFRKNGAGRGAKA